MKLCKKCQKKLPTTDFSKSSTSSDGLYTYCKSCYHLYYKSRYNPRLPARNLTHTGRDCRICQQHKPWSAFKTKKSSYCIECDAIYSHTRNVRRYGITPTQYIEMLRQQDFRCKICQQPDTKRLCVDHDHTCCNFAGSCGHCIRGLICSRCNRVLGMVNDSPHLLLSMADYLGQP